MNFLASFPDVKSRLLALVAFIIVPVALITIVLASAAHQSLLSDIDRQWRQSTDEYAARTRVWLRGAARTLITSGIAASALEDKSQCDSMLQDVLSANDGYQAIRVDFGDGRACVGARGPQFGNFAGEISERLRSKPGVEIERGESLAVAVFAPRGQSVLVIQADAPMPASRRWTATALIDPSLLAAAFELNPQAGDIVALMEKGQRIVAVSGANATDPSWLPAAERAGDASYKLGQASSRTGAMFYYATQPVLGSDLYILGRFDSSARQAAWLRTFVLVVAPLAALAILYIAYSRAIESELLRWIDAIKAAMLARKAGRGAIFAPESEEMPNELRDLAASFNEMIRESEIYEQSLKSSLAENEFLLKELHHRVKTSLQIIQSYLSLTRRLDGSSDEHGSVSAIEARVQVLSIAYRKAFSEGRMRDVRIRQFATEVVDNLSVLFVRPGLTLELKADVSAALMIDRAIPLGLALVESVMAGLAAEDAHHVSVRIGDLDDLRVEVRVAGDGVLALDRPNPKLMAGLAFQLEASVESPDVGTIMRWRFQGGPPPVLVYADGADA
jgi:two-component system, sensor histidine kinase PdtaS